MTGFKIYFQPQNCRKVDAAPHQEKLHGPIISVLWHLDVNHISKAILYPICPSSIDNQNDCVKSAFFWHFRSANETQYQPFLFE